MLYLVRLQLSPPTADEFSGRCHRMNKDCRPSPPMRRRRVMKKPPTSGTSKLEAKLNGLVDLLKSATQGGHGIVIAKSCNAPTEGSGTSNHNGTCSSTITGSIDLQGSISFSTAGGFPDHHFTPATSSSSKSTLVNSQPRILRPTLQPSPEEVESYLNKFRTDFINYLPFIAISPSLSSNQLRQERPILWVCIMAAASSNSTQQIALSNEVRAIIGREAFVEGTRNMDLLLGILVYTAW
jgi:hypothetical protein